MSPIDRRGFEAEMLNDPFLSEAVDGFMSDPGAIDDLPVISQKSYAWVYGLISAVLIIGFLASDSAEDHNTEIVLPALQIQAENLERMDRIYPSDISFERANTIRFPKTAVLLAEDPGISDKPRTNSSLPYYPSAWMDKRDAKDIPVGVPERKVRTRYQIVYIADLKLVKSEFWVEKNMEPDLLKLTNHLPAKYASPELRHGEVLDSPDVEPDFYKMWSVGLNAFTRGNYQLALSAIKELEENTTTNDVNIQFYRGLVFYELSRFPEAIAQFEKAQHNIIPTFRQEAVWYIALSMAANGDSQKANQLFREIANAGGHYANRAQKRLKRIP